MSIFYTLCFTAAGDPIGRVAYGLYLHDRNRFLQGLAAYSAKHQQAILNDWDRAMHTASGVASYCKRAARLLKLHLHPHPPSYFTSPLLDQIDWRHQLKLAIFSGLVSLFISSLFNLLLQIFFQ